MSPRWVDQTFVQRFPSPHKSTPRAHNGTLRDELGKQRRESLFGAHAWAARGQKASLETALAGAKEEEGNLLIIQPEKKKKGSGLGGRRASAQKSPTTHIMRSQWRMNYSGSAPARFRGPVHRGKMAVFTYKMFPFGVGKAAGCLSEWQLRPLKSTHVSPKVARSLPEPAHARRHSHARWKYTLNIYSCPAALKVR